MTRQRWLPRALATGLFAIGLAISLSLANWHERQNEAIATQRLSIAGSALSEALHLRLDSFEHALRGLSGALAGSQDRPASYRRFDEATNLMRAYPGALAAGYAERVSREKTEALLETLGRRYGRAVTLRTINVNNGDRFVVTESSGEMLAGTDLASLTPVREAGLRATWRNEATLSPPIYRAGGDLPTFYLLQPVYRQPTAPEDATGRHDETIGWLFIHLSGERLMGGIDNGKLHLKLVDREGEDNEFLVYDSGAVSSTASMRREFDQKFGGRSWHFVVTPGGAFDNELGQLPPALTLATGLLVSALAALLSHALLVMQARAMALAERMTEALRTSEQRQRAILDNASIGILFSRDRRIQQANAKAAELFGWPSPEAMAGQPGEVFWPSAADYRDIGRDAGPVLTAGGTYEVERPMRRRDGSNFLAYILAKAVDPATASTGTIWLASDVTEPRRIARLLQESERRLAQILDGSPVAIFVLDTERRITHWNRACASLTGLAAAEIIGTRAAWRGFYSEARPTMADLIVAEADDAELARHYANAFSPSTLIAGAVEAESFFPHMPPDGRWLHFMAAPLRDTDGRIVGAIETLVDITPRHTAEAMLEKRTEALQQSHEELAHLVETLTRTRDELVRAEKLAALGAMVAGVAHEMNTPLGNALMLASTLLETGEAFRAEMAGGVRRSLLESFVEQTLNGSRMLIDNLARTARLVDSFKRLAVSQTDAQRSRFNLAERVAEVAGIAASGRDASRFAIERDIPPEIVLDSYAGELEQILLSLIGNAFVHAFEGRDSGRIRIAAAIDGEHVVITVGDDGRGIPPDILPRIFDPFFTTKLGVGDSGLGLNIAYNQASGILGGAISASSTLGEGTRFTLRLPLQAPLPGGAAASATSAG